MKYWWLTVASLSSVCAFVLLILHIFSGFTGGFLEEVYPLSFLVCIFVIFVATRKAQQCKQKPYPYSD